MFWVSELLRYTTSITLSLVSERISVSYPKYVRLGVKCIKGVLTSHLESQGSPGVGRNTFLSSPHLCFIIVFICDLFVSRDDPLMS